METRELENRLLALDNVVVDLGQQIQEMKSRAREMMDDARELEDQACQMMAGAQSADDPDTMSALYSQAQSMFSQAASLSSQAESIKEQARSRETQLKGYRSEYQEYKNAGLANISSLRQAVTKLSGLSDSRYGRNALNQALNESRQRLTYNQNLVNGCDQRMKWIDHICD